MIIKLEKFEGPLALLLKMIEGEELDITTISLVKIADEYVQYIKSAKDIDPEEIADFLVVAAKLLLIKSRALLPYLYPEEDEEIDDFEAQIKMYKEFLEAAKVIEKMVVSNRQMFAREFIKESWLNRQPSFSPPAKVTTEAMRMIFEDVIARSKPAEKITEATIEDHINIEDKINYIKDIVSKKINFYFSHFMKSAKSRTEVIVGFLAILELMKQRDIIIEQVDLFGEIEVKSKI
ncbi:MAG: segregation/condensation protein A [Patescibacteria group bacterium]|nr:segregation/condensation protein A [Patescibacteria group bacterium]